MKADRRHELQSNSLALWMQIRLPEIWAKYGNHILMVLIVIVAGIWFIRWRIEAPKVAAQKAAQLLGGTEELISAMQRGMRPSGETSDVPARLAEAINTSDNKDIRALAYVLLGEYQWVQATMPQMPSTRPGAQPDRSPEEAYKLAADALNNALSTRTQQADLIARAHVGLALIAEQRAFEQVRKDGPGADPARNPYWQQARENYQAIVDAPNMFPLLSDQARARLKELDQMQKPLWLVEGKATTLPSNLLEPLLPAEKPVGSIERPAVPTTRPTTAPAK